MLLILLTSVDPNYQKIPLQDLALLMDNLDMQVHNEKAVWDNVAYDMWGKVLVWVLLLPYHLKGLCDVGVLRSLAICHLQFLVFAVLSRHVPALNVFPCGVPRLRKQTIQWPQIPKNRKLSLYLILMTIYCFMIYSNLKQMFPLPSLFFTLFINI